MVAAYPVARRLPARTGETGGGGRGNLPVPVRVLLPVKREPFRDYVAGSSAALLRTAYLLTGDRDDAEDLLQAALAKAYLHWDRIRDPAAAHAYVRRVLVTTHTSWWRRRRDREVVTDTVPQPAAARDATADADLHDALWSALLRLPRRQRAAVVLRYY